MPAQAGIQYWVPACAGTSGKRRRLNLNGIRGSVPKPKFVTVCSSLQTNLGFDKNTGYVGNLVEWI